MKTFLYASLLIVLLLNSCKPTSPQEKNPIEKKESIQKQTVTGIEVLRNAGFELLKGKRVGLITNPTGVDSKLKSTIDILHEAPEVNLVALYGPEHGVRGNFSAGDHVGDAKDSKTGVRVFSLYGKSRKPSKNMLAGVDVLVFDIQDIGARSYTYISTMGLAMEAAAENNIEFVVLDRPNPIGGNRIEGPLVEKGFFSFISQYPVPYIHGLTPGEFSRFLNGEKLLKNGVTCKLNVVKLENWRRNMPFSETGLPWVPTSPHIPRKNSAYFYSASGIIGELDANTIGVGYTLPFEVFATPWLDGEKLAKRMNEFGMKGVIFRPIHFKPYYMKKKGIEHSGVQVHITNFDSVHLTEIQFRFAEAAFELAPEHALFLKKEKRYRSFDIVCGSDTIRKTFTKRYKYDDIKSLWENGTEEYRKKVKQYYLYD